MDDKQQLINQIATLSSAIDPLLRAKKEEVVNEVAEKIRELLKQL